jgi:hypothetical protein
VPSGAIVWEARNDLMMPAVVPSPRACRPIAHGCSVRGRCLVGPCSTGPGDMPCPVLDVRLVRCSDP